MKKILSITLISLLICSIFVGISIGAEENEKDYEVDIEEETLDRNAMIALKCDDTELVAGNKITITVKLTLLNAQKANGIAAYLFYDETVLSFVKRESFSQDEEISWERPSSSAKDGILSIITYRDEEYASLSGDVCNIVFEVLKDVDSTQITIDETECSYIDQSIYPRTFTLNLPTESLYLSTDVYEIGENDIYNYEGGDKYIAKIDEYTTLEQFVNNIKTNGDIRVLKSDLSELTNDEYVKTGMTLEVTDGITVITLETIVDEKDIYLSTEKYKIGNENINNYENGDKYISRVERETTKVDFVNNLDTNGTIKIIKADGTELLDTELVGTGMTLEVTKDEEKVELKIVVIGDLTGEGKITATDLSTVNQTILKLITLENEYIIAADFDENDKITATDLSTINKMLLEIL